MTVTMQAKIQVGTADLRDAFRAVQPIAPKVTTGDDLAEFRVRLIFAGGWVFCCTSSSNKSVAALAKVVIRADTRGALGILEPDDGPITIDLQPRHVKNILQMFKAKGDNAVDQLLEFSIDLTVKKLRILDIGGLWSNGEAVEMPIEDPAEAFPDLLAIVARAHAGIGATQVGKPLVTDSKIIALFKEAGRVYGTPLAIEGTGTPESGGFVVSCGPHFLGTVESHHDEDTLGNRRRWREAWLDLLPAKKLAAV